MRLDLLGSHQEDQGTAFGTLYVKLEAEELISCLLGCWISRQNLFVRIL